MSPMNTLTKSTTKTPWFRIGQNPTSGTLSVTRRKDIYALCCKYDIIIIEDDPYWYLQFPSASKLSPNFPAHPHNYSTSVNDKGRSSGFHFLDSLVPSYLSVDTQGRVVRLDTFSKTVAPGCRLGWITAQPAIVERILRITETSTQQPSGFVQAMIAELIMGPQSPSDGGRGGSKDGCGWKVDGWVRWLEGLRGNYERRMNTMCQILGEGKYHVKTSPSPNPSTALSLSQKASQFADLSLSTDSFSSDDLELITKTQMFSFTPPLGGMFLWLRLHLSTHPLFGKLPPPKLSAALWAHLTEPPYLALVAPGEMFSPTADIAKEEGWQFFRLCFAAIDEGELERCCRGVVEGCRTFWDITDLGDIEEVVRKGEGEKFSCF
jgi:DNA-binding transcriptional MocR family regulator